MPVVIRRATKEDAAVIADFAVALFELHAMWNAKRFTQIATKDGAERYYADRAEYGSVLIAENEGKPVGFAYFEYEPVLYAELATKVAWLHDIYVEPESRGMGAARGLLDAVADDAKRLGANKVLLSVAVENTAGRELFQRNGFETTMHEMMRVLDSAL
jgi:GNAT superfamily N-acetyltransferase